jgi:hypothetical protein
MSEHVNSASDERTVNNVMRHEYRVLTAAEKEWMKKIKDDGLQFWELLHDCGNTEYGASFASRELSIAATKIEEATMWAIKHLTK